MSGVRFTLDAPLFTLGRAFTQYWPSLPLAGTTPAPFTVGPWAAVALYFPGMDPAGSELQMKTIEFRVRPVTRYNLTRYEDDPENRCGSCVTLGEFSNAEAAHDVAIAMQASAPGSTYTPFQGAQIGGQSQQTRAQQDEWLNQASGGLNASAAQFVGSRSMGRDGVIWAFTEDGWKKVV